MQIEVKIYLLFVSAFHCHSGDRFGGQVHLLLRRAVQVGKVLVLMPL